MGTRPNRPSQGRRSPQECLLHLLEDNRRVSHPRVLRVVVNLVFFLLCFALRGLVSIKNDFFLLLLIVIVVVVIIVAGLLAARRSALTFPSGCSPSSPVAPCVPSHQGLQGTIRNPKS